MKKKPSQAFQRTKLYARRIFLTNCGSCVFSSSSVRATSIYLSCHGRFMETMQNTFDLLIKWVYANPRQLIVSSTCDVGKKLGTYGDSMSSVMY